MGTKWAEVTLHIDEETTHDQRENFRDRLLGKDGVITASCHDERPHSMLIEYDPEIINSREFLTEASNTDLHAELIGF
ncbi:MAG: ATP-binding protein [Gammaproteobacteria bacterium]